MYWNKKSKRFVKAGFFLCLILILAVAATCDLAKSVFSDFSLKVAASNQNKKSFIKWVDFNVSYPALEKAMNLDIETYDSEVHIGWTDTLAYLSCKYGNNFKQYKAKDIDAFAAKLHDGETVASLTKDMKFFSYYKECYEATLGEFLGEYKIEIASDKFENSADTAVSKKWVEKYGLKVFSPIADGFWSDEYDDFGVSRSYGYKRRHLGHDMMIGVGAPVIAVESGIVEALGWNQYGGWRIGIRSFDDKRYYYYAHLRKDRPYAAGLYVGKAVNAGDVIGYTGQTGYSNKENVNNINSPHLHFGMQLIFNESQREGPSEIWIDVYNICKLLSKNKSAVVKDVETREYSRKYNFSEPNYFLRNSTIYASTKPAVPEGSIPVPIVMYHSLIKDPSAHNDFVISPQVFENDLKYLKEKGYTTIVMKDLIDYVYKGVPLPEKPVMLTFDDGHYNNYTYAFPLLEKYEMKAVISVIGSITDKASELNENNPAYSYLTWEQIDEMIKSGYVEIQNHSYDLHTCGSNRRGAAIRRGENADDYQQLLLSDIGLLQHKIVKSTGYYPSCFTYPFGQVSKESRQVLKDMGFQATLGCRSGVNYILPDDTDQLFNLRRNLRPPYTPSWLFFKDICPSQAHT